MRRSDFVIPVRRGLSGTGLSHFIRAKFISKDWRVIGCVSIPGIVARPGIDPDHLTFRPLKLGQYSAAFQGKKGCRPQEQTRQEEYQQPHPPGHKPPTVRQSPGQEKLRHVELNEGCAKHQMAFHLSRQSGPPANRNLFSIWSARGAYDWSFVDHHANHTALNSCKMCIQVRNSSRAFGSSWRQKKTATLVATDGASQSAIPFSSRRRAIHSSFVSGEPFILF